MIAETAPRPVVSPSWPIVPKEFGRELFPRSLPHSLSKVRIAAQLRGSSRSHRSRTPDAI